MKATKQIIGDNFESGGGNIYIAKDQAIQTNYSITPQSSVEDLLKLLQAVQQELTNAPIPEAVKAEVVNEVEGANFRRRRIRRRKKDCRRNSKMQPPPWKKAQKPSKAR